MVNDYQINDRIIIKGEKTHQEIAKEMQMANAFVLFSNIENLPLVLIEAMATGIPIIATKVGGITELVNDDLGLLVKKGDTNALTNGMKFLMENYAKYDPSKIRDYAVSNFSYENVGDQFNELYNEIIKN
jgi:glycosyltransferase involved in cell wall biosynthesis